MEGKGFDCEQNERVGVFWGEFKERECREGKVCSEEMVMVAIGKQNEKLRTREQRSNLQVIRKWLIRGSWAFVSTNGLFFL